MKTQSKSTNCDKLWRVWYGILITSLHIFLVYVGISRYLAFKSQAFDAKFGGDWNQSGMNFTLAMIILALVFLCLFSFTCLTRTSNYANEGMQIGRDTDNLHLLTAVSQHWRNNVPMMTLSGSQINNNTYSAGLPITGGLVQRSGFTAGSDDDRGSAMGGEDIIPGPNFDTWSGKSGPNPEVFQSAYLGANEPRLHPTTTNNETSGHLSVRRSLRILWHRFQRHFLPYANMLHLVSAYCLCLPIPIIHAQQIFHRALPIDYVWRSDLDILFGQDSIKPDIVMVGAAASAAAGAISSVQPKVNLPEESGQAAYYSQWDNLRAISPEFFNLALVFMLLSLRYPSVFWYTSRAFSFVFSLLLLLTGLHVLIEFSAATVLVKLACNRQLLTTSLSWVSSLRIVTVPRKSTFASGSRNGENFILKDSHTADRLTTEAEVLNPLYYISPLALCTTGTFIFLCLFITIFEYGYRQFTEDLATYRHYLVGSANGTGFGLAQPDPYLIADAVERRSNNAGPIYHTSVTNESVHSIPNGSGKSNPTTPTQLISRSRPSRHYSYGVELLHPACRCCLHAYAPHICGLIGSLFVLAFKIPVMWDCVQVYRNSRNTLMLAAPLSGIIVTCAWFIMWLAFSMKPSWKFQVNLPLQTITGSSHQPAYPNLPVSGTGRLVQSPLLMGSILRHSGLGLDRFSQPNIGSLHSPTVNTANGLLTPQQITACFTTEDGHGNQITVPGSPMYACFHDQAPGYYGTAVSGMTRAIRLPGNAEFGLPVSGSGFIGLNNMGMATRSVEYCSEDTEASSGRQSRNNYVCLQSALHSTGHAGVLVPTDGGTLMTRLLHSTTPTPPPPPPPPPAPPPVPAPPLLQGSAQLSSHSGQPPLPPLPIPSQHTFSSGALVLSSPVVGREVNDDDTGSTNTIQPTGTLRAGPPSFPSHSASSFGLVRHAADQAVDGPGQCGANVSTSRANTSVLTRFPGSAGTRQSPVGNSVAPRVTFKENIDTIASVSPNASDPGSQNTSSNDSGIDNLKPVETNPLNGNNADSSGTYDNAFTPTVRSTVVIRSPSQTMGNRNELLSETGPSGTLPRILTTTSTYPTSSSHAVMNASVYSNRLPTFGTYGQGSEQTPLLDSTDSDLSNLLKPPGLSLTTTRLSRQNEMIGDGASSLQSSSTVEPYPLLLSSCMLNDETHEPRLCSQV